MCFVRISEQTANFDLYTINGLISTTEIESVYCALLLESVPKTDTFVLKSLS